MLRLVSADRPALVCLQEIPAWALERLDDWSAMTAVSDVAQRPTLGPFPSTAGIGRLLTVDHGRLRSAFAGQANAVLVDPALRVVDHRVVVLNPRSFRRAQARWLGLDPIARLGWARERRICQAVRMRLQDGTTLLVGNLHATSYPADERLADAELLRAATFVDGLARPGEPVLLAGDFNVTGVRSRTLADLTGAEWGFAGPGPGIDHVLVRGLDAGPAERWRDERRLVDGRLLSDHAPIEVRAG
jgi:endonuclease/exonuclease/phosphatase family metal-dependent hydrolase